MEIIIKYQGYEIMQGNSLGEENKSPTEDLYKTSLRFKNPITFENVKLF